jgi:dihydrofolate reductase
MGKIILTENISLDGVIEAVDDWFSPAGDDADNGDLIETIRRQMKTQQGLLLGRKTFEQFRQYWPHQSDDTTGITAHLNQVSKFVFSSTLKEPGWENTSIIRGELAAEVAKLKQKVAGDIGVTGSITLVHALLAAGFVDECRLFMYPVAVGRGRRLFENGTKLRKFELMDSKSFRSGIVLSSYRRQEK